MFGNKEKFKLHQHNISSAAVCQNTKTGRAKTQNTEQRKRGKFPGVNYN